MHISIVAAVDPWTSSASGVRSYSLALGRKLVALGQEVTLLGLGERPTEIGGLRVVPVAARVRDSAQFVVALGMFLKKNGVPKGIVHANRPDDLVPFHLCVRDRPSVVTLHGVHGVHVAIRRGRIAASVYHAMERYSLDRIGAALCVSPGTLDHFRQTYPHLAGRLQLLPSGIDLDRFRPQDKAQARRRFGLPDEAKVIAFAGRFEPEKNPLAVVEAFREVSTRHQEVHLALIGQGRLGSLLRLAANASGDCMSVIDPLPQDQFAWLLNGADVLVVSSFHEGLPTVALEALACGVPVVATRVGILPTIVDPGKNGFLVDSPGQLPGMIEKALFETTWAGGSCRESVAGFAWERVAASIMEVYNAIST